MISAIVGGLIIGFAVSLMLVFNGRVTGISGIISNTLTVKKHDWLWRFLFIMGLVIGGFFLKYLAPELMMNTSNRSNLEIIIGGFLVGFGTLLGSGCTSGHGVCGISRLSMRSIIATILFIGVGVLTVFIMKAV